MPFLKGEGETVGCSRKRETEWNTHFQLMPDGMLVMQETQIHNPFERRTVR